MTNKINFQKRRDLGEIITDTFGFLRENLKPLSKAIFKITGPVFLILLLALSYYSYLGMDLMENSIFEMAEEMSSEMYLISLFILGAAIFAFYILLYATILHYIKSYVEHDGVVNETEVYQGVKDNFGGMLGILLLSTIMVAVGTLLCILPGVYLWVPLSIAPAVLVFSQRPVMDSISHTFDLVKDNWWTTFFSFFVIALLIYIIGLIFQFPMMIYFFVKAITSSQEGSLAEPGSLIDWVYVVFNVVSSLAQYLLTGILVIASTFIYYNLDEKKNSTGSYQTISNLGSQENNS